MRETWDNVAAETFFATLKNEMYHQQVFHTGARARFAVAEYIEVFYNRRRPHSSIGYRTPARHGLTHTRPPPRTYPRRPDTSETTEDLSTILNTAQSAANLIALDDAELSFIVGSRTSRAQKKFEDHFGRRGNAIADGETVKLTRPIGQARDRRERRVVWHY